MRLGLVLAATGLAASVAVAAIAAPDAPVSTTTAGTPDVSTRGRLPAPTTATVAADLLGEDSVIAVVGHGDTESADARSLEVITPDGVRHPVYSVELGESSSGLPSRGDFTLADWRPEMQTALLNISRSRAGSTAVAYDVVTGATREIALPKRAISVGLDPDGTGVLMTTYADRGAASIWTLSWDGVESPLPGSSGGSPMTSVDGRTLVTGAAHSRRWWVIDLAARTAVALQPPGRCSIIRWLDADSVLTSCYRRGVNQLRSVDTDGTSTVLGVRHRVRGRGIFLDGDVREVQGRRWFASHEH